MTAPVIYWYRQDLRLSDLPGLQAASDRGQVIPCYILDDDSPGAWAPGTASRWWLNQSLTELAEQVADAGGQLVIARGKPEDVLATLASETGASAVYCSELYEPWARDSDQRVEQNLSVQGVSLHRCAGTT